MTKHHIEGRPPTEPDLVPYQATDIGEIRPMLVLAPHPDDEVFGSGGLIALAAAHGVPVHICVATDGALAGDAAVREAESLAAAEVLGGQTLRAAIQFWRLPDRGLQPDDALRDRIQRAIEASAAQWVIVPSPFEVHPDHRALCRATVEVASRLTAAGRHLQLVFCEIGQALMPNRLVDISPVIERKARAMRCFVSQQTVQAYGDQMTGLNRYRAYTLGPNVSHAEAYWFVPAPVLAGGLSTVLAEAAVQLARRF